tara:strand:- start:15 stop:398 length:384 start_codon:yes stop_codon:yes gene_type:complete
MRNYYLFKGRASRSEFWYFILFWIIFYLIVIFLDSALGLNFIDISRLPYSQYIPLANIYEKVGLFTFMYRPVTLLPSLSVMTRRLHDIGKSGWWCVLCVTPLIFILIFFLAKKSDDCDNKFGEVPAS